MENTELNKGQENRRKRAVKKWLLMWELYTHPLTPLTVEQIAKKVRKKNGKAYTRQYVYKAFKKLEEMGLINQQI